MIEIVLYIVAPSLLALLVRYGAKDLRGGSDHSIHLHHINRIKANRHRFTRDYVLHYNEKHPFYPQLYHWALSFLPRTVYSERYAVTVAAIAILEVVAFNMFLAYLYSTIEFEPVTFLYANLVFHAFPFSYAAWNAKNTGLSARGIGLVAGQIYVYCVVAYLFSGSLWLLGAIWMMVLVILLLSQMAMQFTVLSLPIIAIVCSVPELLPIPLLAFGLFYLLMPQVAANYVIGQFNHKRNYALFIADVFFLRERPSIYRDLVYDFWVKLRSNWRRALAYMYGNPLIELVYGFPFLWLVIYTGETDGFSNRLSVLYRLVLIALVLFVATSFRATRFLGEPQRYVEFVIPLVTVLFVVGRGWQSIVVIVLFATLVIVMPNHVLKRYATPGAKRSSVEGLLSYLRAIKTATTQVIIGNDSELLKEIAGVGYEICKLDPSRFYRTRADYHKYLLDDYAILSPYAIREFLMEYSPSMVVVNTQHYGIEQLAGRVDSATFTFVSQFSHLQLYTVDYGRR